jgi:hypothetical protein
VRISFTPEAIHQFHGEAIQSQRDQQVIDIDSGCVYPKLHGFGYLVAMNLSTGEFFAKKTVSNEKGEGAQNFEPLLLFSLLDFRLMTVKSK